MALTNQQKQKAYRDRQFLKKRRAAEIIEKMISDFQAGNREVDLLRLVNLLDLLK